MTGQEWSTLIGALGFPVFFVLALMWFGRRDVWPQVVAWYETTRAESARRHAEFIDAVKRNQASEEITGKMLLLIDQKLSEHRAEADAKHDEVVGILRSEIVPRLERIDKNTNGFGKK